MSSLSWAVKFLLRATLPSVIGDADFFLQVRYLIHLQLISYAQHFLRKKKKSPQNSVFYHFIGAITPLGFKWKVYLHSINQLLKVIENYFINLNLLIRELMSFLKTKKVFN